MKMIWIWILIAGVLLLGLIIGIVLYFIYKNKQRQSLLVQALPMDVSPQRISSTPYSDTTVQRDYSPYRVVGARDGSWFQVLDRQEDVVAQFSTPQGQPTFEAECTDGQVEFIGVKSTLEGNRLGPIGCVTSTDPSQIQYVGQQGNVERVYSLGRVFSSDTDCPSGLRRLMNSDGVTGSSNGNVASRLSNGIGFICVPDDQCQFHSDCPEDYVCTGGNCVPIENISDF